MEPPAGEALALALAAGPARRRWLLHELGSYSTCRGLTFSPVRWGDDTAHASELRRGPHRPVWEPPTHRGPHFRRTSTYSDPGSARSRQHWPLSPLHRFKVDRTSLSPSWGLLGPGMVRACGLCWNSLGDGSGPLPPSEAAGLREAPAQAGGGTCSQARGSLWRAARALCAPGGKSPARPGEPGRAFLTGLRGGFPATRALILSVR